MARLARRRDSYPVRHIYSAIRFVLTFFQGHYGQLHLRAWTESNCQGKIAFTTFNNISFAYLSRSFKLCRPLQGQKQLDISVTGEFETWFSDKDQLFYQFQQSDSAFNGSTDYHNTPDFTCYRLWINPGLWTTPILSHVEHTICRVGTWKDKFIFKP